MILTNCAACATPLAHNAPRCVRCKLRYCDSTCQHDHWRRGHKQMCKKIHRGGNAEQYHANKKYNEWYRTFGKVFLESVPVADRAAFLDDYRTACAHRLGGENRLDFVRLRWRAVRRDDRSR